MSQFHNAANLLAVDQTGAAPQATHVALRDGPWFDPTIWQGERIPDDGALVHIPSGTVVTYDGESAADHFIIRVDGALDLTARDGAATRLTVDTLLGAPGSRISAHASSAQDGTIDIIFSETAPSAHHQFYSDRGTDNGVLGRHAWDPEQLSLGLVSAGEISLAGRPIDAGLQMVSAPMSGDRHITLDISAPGAGVGWAVGQTIVIAGTRYQARDPDLAMPMEDEVRRIADLTFDGEHLHVVLDAPLQHDHAGPPDPGTGTAMAGYVGNLSRSVTMSSLAANREGDGTPERAVPFASDPGDGGHHAAQRGHVMVTHADQVDISHTAFHGLGRTDKSRPIDDLATGGVHNSRLYRDGGEIGAFDPGTDTLITTGADEITNQRGRYALHLHEGGINGDGAMITGNAIWGSPGWGLAQHGSAATVAGNLVYDVAGAAYVAESGDELGVWRDNLAIGTYGARDTKPNQDSDDANEDDGASGTGFYLKSRAIEVIDNVAQGSARAGFFFHNLGSGLRETPVSSDPLLDAIANGIGTLATEDTPIRAFTGNRAFVAHEGLRIVTDPHDSVRKFSDSWSHMSDFTAWEIDLAGVMVTYSSKYIFQDFRLFGTEQKVTDYAIHDNAGFFFESSVADVTVRDGYAAGFDHAVMNWSQLGGRQERLRGYWDPKDPTGDLRDAPSYSGLGSVDGITNPAYNLWNTNIAGLEYDDIDGMLIRTLPMEVETTNGAVESLRGRELWFSSAAIDPSPDVQIDLLDDSRDGALVALWREDIAEHQNQRAMLAEHIPLTYGSTVYLDRIDFDTGPLIRRDLLDHAPGINADTWSGTVLEFAKTDSLGRHVHRYGDFAPLDWAGATRAVTTNERIVFTRDMIDAALVRDGYVRFPNIADLRFVVMETVFTDRFTGDASLRKVLIALDRAWELPEGTRDGGTILIDDDIIAAQIYRPFLNGEPVADAAPVVLDPSAAPIGEEVRIARFTSDGDDVMNMGAQANTVDGGGGDDLIRGYGGPDRLFGGQGQDTLSGGDGWDRLFGGDGADRLDGHLGRDTLNGGAGNDSLAGAAGADTLIGGSAEDILSGGNWHDLLDGGADDDFLFSGIGRDTLFGGDGFDKLNAGSGADLIYGGEGQDTLWARAGRDTLYGDGGDDQLWGENGADMIYAGSGDDTLFAGLGRDRLFGGDGQDKLFAGSGHDWLRGGAGDDWLEGGNGEDRFVFAAGDGNDVVSDFDPVRDSVLILRDDPATSATLNQNGIDTVLDYDGLSVLFLATDRDDIDLQYAGG